MHKLLVIILLGWINLIWGTNHYVDKNATGNNSGTSWSNAWNSFGSIDWNSIQAGDTLYISGGSNSKTYFETLNINATQGTSTNRIIITKGKTAGHNGEVIIDGQNSRSSGIANQSSNNNYITISHLTVKNNTFRQLDLDDMDNAIIEYINMPLSTGVGISMYDMENATVANCTYTSVSNSGDQTDGIVFERCHRLIIEYCTISQFNNNTSSHNDCIQKYDEPTGVYDFTIRYNKIETWTSDQINTQGIFFEDASGVVQIYNNLVNGHDNNKAQLNFKTIQQEAEIYIYNNTFIGGSNVDGDIVRFDVEEGTPTIEFKNNITLCISTGHNLIKINGSANATFDYNQWYSPNDDGVFDGATWSSWQSSGRDPNGNNSDPSLNSSFQPDNVSDPPVNNGTTLSLFSDDIDGTSRPQGSAWDIGCYEYIDRGPDITPPEVTGATLLDSVTLKVMFSEALDGTTAEDETNYSISNNIDVFSASLSGSDVILQTSVHTPNVYTVTVINVEDLAGNPIDPSANTAEYTFVPIPLDSIIQLPIQDVYGVIQEPEHTPLKTIDGLGAYNGDPDSRWAAEPMPEELVFDLGTVRNVCKTRLSFFRWDQGRVYDYSIFASNNNIDWDLVIDQTSSASQEEWTIDEFPPIDVRYVKLKFINNNESEWAGLWEGEIWGVQVTEVDPINEILPDAFSLDQNYPNPFNPTTKIRYTIPERANVVLKVFNSIGQEVAELVNSNMNKGVYEIDFNASRLASGIYIYRIIADNFVDTKKMILLR